MRKYLIPYLLILSAGLIGIHFLFKNIIIAQTQSSGAAKVNRIKTNTDPNEIPILGSSRAEGSFIPDSLGLHFFNYGMAGVQDDVWLYFLKIELAKGRNTPIVINLDADGLQRIQSGLVYWLFDTQDSTVRTFIGKEWKPIHHLPVIRNFGYFEIHLANYLNEKFELTGNRNKGAILELKKLSRQEFDDAVQKRLESKLIATHDPKIYADLLTTLSNTKGRKVIMVIPPYHYSYLRSIQNKEDILRLQTTLDSLPNVHILDYAQMNLDDSLFYNTTHLNKKGAILFNRYLKKHLDSILTLKTEKF